MTLQSLRILVSNALHKLQTRVAETPAEFFLELWLNNELLERWPAEDPEGDRIMLETALACQVDDGQEEPPEDFSLFVTAFEDCFDGEVFDEEPACQLS